MARIVFVSTFPPEPLMSGFAMRIYGLLSTVPDRHDLLRIYPESSAWEKFPPDVSFSPGKVTRIKEYLSLVPRILLPYSSSRDKQNVINSIKEFKPDCVIVSGVHVFPFIPGNIKVIYDSHNIEWHLSMSLFRNTRSSAFVKLHRYFTYLKLKRYEIQIAENADHMIACSKTDASYFSALRSDHVPVVYNGVDIDYWDIPRNPRRGYLLFSGDMNYYPNIEAARFIAYEILPILKARGWSGKLVLCGKNPAPEVQSLASSEITVTGTVDDLRMYYSQAELLIAPMRTGSGTPLKVITAMAAGVPVITTHRVAESLGISDSDTVLQADQPEKIAEKILQLYNDTSMAEMYSERGKIVAEERFSWSVVGSSFWKQIEEFLGR